MLEQLFDEFYKLHKQQAEHYSAEITEQMNLIERQIEFLLEKSNQKELDKITDEMTALNLEIALAEKNCNMLKAKKMLCESRLNLIYNTIDNETSKKMN